MGELKKLPSRKEQNKKEIIRKDMVLNVKFLNLKGFYHQPISHNKMFYQNHCSLHSHSASQCMLVTFKTRTSIKLLKFNFFSPF